MSFFILLIMRLPLLIPLALAAAALGMALLSQYGFGTHPCHLCVLQRYPYGVVMVVAAFALVLRRRALIRPILLLSALAFLTTGGIGAYHVGVENGWIEASDACAADTSVVADIDALRAQILSAPLVSCTDVGASFAGVSMPVWNVLYALTAAGFCLWLRRRNEK